MAATRNRQLFIALMVAFLALGFVLDWLGYITPVRTLVQSTIAPLQESLTSVAQDVTRRDEASENLAALQTKTTELEALVNGLMIENIQLKELERENHVLRQLLNYTRSNPQFNYETSAVVGRSLGFDPTNLLYFVYLDVGTRDGIAKNMPVITDRGLVGRVTAAGASSAQVLMLIDPGSAVNAVIQNSQASGVVRGNIDGTLQMERIPPSESVSPGDIVLTSGLGGNFPSKLVIGQVTEVTQRDQDMFQTARIRPTVDFGKLEIMLVVTTFEPVDFEAEILDNQEDNN